MSEGVKAFLLAGCISIVLGGGVEVIWPYHGNPPHQAEMSSRPTRQGKQKTTATVGGGAYQLQKASGDDSHPVTNETPNRPEGGQNARRHISVLNVTITDVVVAVSAAISAGVGVAILFVYRDQRGIMSGQLVEAKAAANAAGAAARAAATQASVAEQTISILERPRLFPICEPNFVAPLDSLTTHYVTHDRVPLHGIPSVGFALKNYGRTPAILFNISAKVTGPGNEPPSEDTSYPPFDLPKERVVHPSTSSEVRVAGLSAFKGEISRSDCNDLMAGRKFWWFFGTVGFDDIWGGKNMFHFCWRYDQSLRSFNPYPRERNYTNRDGPDTSFAPLTQ